MSPEATAVLDTPLDASLETPDIDEHSDGLPAESPESSETPGVPDSDGRPATPELPAGDIKAQVEKTIQEIKATNPRIAKELKEAHYLSTALKREFPGERPIKAAVAAKQTLEKFGGAEGLQERSEELAYFHDIDAKFTAGDAKFIEDLTSTPETQAAYLKVAPAMAQKWEQLNPEGHASYISRNLDKFAAAYPNEHGAYLCQNFVADLQANNIPLWMERLSDVIPADNPRAVEIIANLNKYFSRISQFAKMPSTVQDKPLPKGPEPSAVDAREQQVAQREQSLKATEWKNESNRNAMDLFDSEWGRITKGLNLSEQRSAQLKELALERITKATAGNAAFRDKAGKYFLAGQKDGYLKFVKSEYAVQIPKLIRDTMNIVGIKAAAPAPNGGTPGAPKPVASGAPAPKAQAGTTRVGKAPGASEINYRLTTTDMVKSHQAVLKNGRRVSW